MLRNFYSFITVRKFIGCSDKYVSVFIGYYFMVFKASNEVVFEKNDKIV